MTNIEKKIDQVTQILSLSVEITSSSIIDIFVDFSSHVKSLAIRVLLNGWEADPMFKEYDFTRTIYIDWDNGEEKLQEVIDYLKKIKEEL